MEREGCLPRPPRNRQAADTGCGHPHWEIELQSVIGLPRELNRRLGPLSRLLCRAQSLHQLCSEGFAARITRLCSQAGLHWGSDRLTAFFASSDSDGGTEVACYSTACIKEQKSRGEQEERADLDLPWQARPWHLAPWQPAARAASACLPARCQHQHRPPLVLLALPPRLAQIAEHSLPPVQWRRADQPVLRHCGLRSAPRGLPPPPFGGHRCVCAMLPRLTAQLQHGGPPRQSMCCFSRHPSRPKPSSPPTPPPTHPLTIQPAPQPQTSHKQNTFGMTLGPLSSTAPPAQYGPSRRAPPPALSLPRGFRK